MTERGLRNGWLFVGACLFLAYLLLFEQRLSAPDVFTSRAWPSVRAALWKSLPAFFAGVALFIFMKTMNAPTLVPGGAGRLEYLRTQPFMWLHYGRLFFVPAGLSADSDWAPIPHWYDTRVIVGLLFISLLLRVLWISSKTPSSRPIAFGIAWFALALLPASSIFPLAEVTNDHRPFFAYIGLSLAVVWGLALFFQKIFEKYPRVRPLMAPTAWAMPSLPSAAMPWDL